MQAAIWDASHCLLHYSIFSSLLMMYMRNPTFIMFYMACSVIICLYYTLSNIYKWLNKQVSAAILYDNIFKIKINKGYHLYSFSYELTNTVKRSTTNFWPPVNLVLYIKSNKVNQAKTSARSKQTYKINRNLDDQSKALVQWRK